MKKKKNAQAIKKAPVSPQDCCCPWLDAAGNPLPLCHHRTALSLKTPRKNGWGTWQAEEKRPLPLPCRDRRFHHQALRVWLYTERYDKGFALWHPQDIFRKRLHEDQLSESFGVTVGRTACGRLAELEVING